ncbi:MAG: hypothetical protein ACTSRA_00960 [Promethearchaeota archaeon]|nr:MAG: hypothetical protein [Helarchaeota virus Nidhogg Meg22_1012]URC17347.1 MAG: hypothetical protein [Helarchaeota virus Nidhogg Meg22_1214]
MDKDDIACMTAIFSTLVSFLLLVAIGSVFGFLSVMSELDDVLVAIYVIIVTIVGVTEIIIAVATFIVVLWDW